jgi:predicted ArsR family transcriptional regulator
MVERERVGDNEGSTASEAIMRLAYLGEAVPETGSIARRITDLAERGLIETVPAGDGTPLTRPGASGKSQQAWRTTEHGRAELQRALATIESEAA